MFYTNFLHYLNCYKITLGLGSGLGLAQFFTIYCFKINFSLKKKKAFFIHFFKNLTFFFFIYVAKDGDEFAIKIFYDAGAILAKHICIISRHFDEVFFFFKC